MTDDTPLPAKGFLEDTLLIATHSIGDGCFDKTLIYMCQHDADGALGLIINMPLQRLGIKSLMEELDITCNHQLPDYPVYFGGPVDTNQGFIIHSDDAAYPSSINHPSGICFSSGVSTLKDIASGNGPEKIIVTLGCASWSPGQLDDEFSEGKWLSLPAKPALIFDTEADEQWQAAADSIGVNIDQLALTVGHA